MNVLYTVGRTRVNGYHMIYCYPHKLERVMQINIDEFCQLHYTGLKELIKKCKENVDITDLSLTRTDNEFTLIINRLNDRVIVDSHSTHTPVENMQTEHTVPEKNKIEYESGKTDVILEDGYMYKIICTKNDIKLEVNMHIQKSIIHLKRKSLVHVQRYQYSTCSEIRFLVRGQ